MKRPVQPLGAAEEAQLHTLQRFYDQVYYNNIGQVNSARPLARHYRRLAKKLGIGRGTKVLDVACGCGEWLVVCHAAAADIAGVDLSPKAIAVCRERLPQGQFYAQAAEALPFAAAQFDVITCLGSLEHFVNAEQALQEMRRVARGDARVILLVPNAGFLTRRVGLYHGTNQAAIKEEVKSLPEWQAMFENAGLTVVEKWKDLHMLCWHWLRRRGWLGVPLRLLQVCLLSVWPLKWQYQVYHYCEVAPPRADA